MNWKRIKNKRVKYMAKAITDIGTYTISKLNIPTPYTKEMKFTVQFPDKGIEYAKNKRLAKKLCKYHYNIYGKN